MPMNAGRQLTKIKQQVANRPHGGDQVGTSPESSDGVSHRLVLGLPRHGRGARECARFECGEAARNVVLGLIERWFRRKQRLIED